MPSVVVRYTATLSSTNSSVDALELSEEGKWMENTQLPDAFALAAAGALLRLPLGGVSVFNEVEAAPFAIGLDAAFEGSINGSELAATVHLSAANGSAVLIDGDLLDASLNETAYEVPTLFARFGGMVGWEVADVSTVIVDEDGKNETETEHIREVPYHATVEFLLSLDGGNVTAGVLAAFAWAAGEALNSFPVSADDSIPAVVGLTGSHYYFSVDEVLAEVRIALPGASAGEAYEAFEELAQAGAFNTSALEALLAPRLSEMEASFGVTTSSGGSLAVIASPDFGSDPPVQEVTLPPPLPPPLPLPAQPPSPPPPPDCPPPIIPEPCKKCKDNSVGAGLGGAVGGLVIGAAGMWFFMSKKLDTEWQQLQHRRATAMAFSPSMSAGDDVEMARPAAPSADYTKSQSITQSMLAKQKVAQATVATSGGDVAAAGGVWDNPLASADAGVAEKSEAESSEQRRERKKSLGAPSRSESVAARVSVVMESNPLLDDDAGTKWATAADEDGDIYFFNVDSGETTWERPADYDGPELEE